MRRIYQLAPAILMLLSLWSGLLLVLRTPLVMAETASAPSLVVSQLKITSSNGQFITLHNTTTAPIDMSKYQLQYFNNYDLSKATSSRLISLSGILAPQGYYMVNDSALLLCYRLTVDSQSLGLSSTSGMVQVLSLTQASVGAPAVPVLQDYVGWTKTAAVGAQTLPVNVNAFLQRQPMNAQNNPLVGTPGAGSWQTVQPDINNPCNLVTSSGAPVATPGTNQLLPSTEPPASIVSLASEAESTTTIPVLPASDIGLQAPQITELLPNPAGTGNDSTDEFIELYNPNNATFDLTGFSLQTGLTTTRKYSFPSGTLLPGRSFTAFYSEATALSLSNTSGQAKLLDPFGNTISAGEAYTTAKDGIAWALAKGKWYWTTSLTPNAANVITQPSTAKKTKASASKTKKATTGAKTTKTTVAAASAFGDEEPTTTPIHIWTLAVVVALALLYAAYEYRTDMADRFRRLRRYFGFRPAGRS